MVDHFPHLSSELSKMALSFFLPSCLPACLLAPSECHIGPLGGAQGQEQKAAKKGPFTSDVRTEVRYQKRGLVLRYIYGSYWVSWYTIIQGGVTGSVNETSHRKWREIDLQPCCWLQLALPGWCLVSLLFLCGVSLTDPVKKSENFEDAIYEWPQSGFWCSSLSPRHHSSNLPAASFITQRRPGMAGMDRFRRECKPRKPSLHGPLLTMSG